MVGSSEDRFFMCRGSIIIICSFFRVKIKRPSPGSRKLLLWMNMTNMQASIMVSRVKLVFSDDSKTDKTKA